MIRGHKLGRSLFALAAVLTMAISAVGTGAQAAEPEYRLRIAHSLSMRATSHAQLLQPWAEKIQEESGGRIQFDIFPAMQLGGQASQLYEQVRSGLADVVWTLTGYTPGRFPLTEVFELPFMPASAEATSQALMDFHDRHLQEEFKDIHVILLHVHAPGTLHTRSRLVTGIQDIAGLKIRLPNRSIALALNEIGAVPVGMPAAQTYEALAKNVVDGALLPFEVVRGIRTNELTPFHTFSNFYTSVFLFAMNKQTYEGLPPDLRAIIDRNSRHAIVAEAGRIWDAAEEHGLNQAQELGHTFHTLTPEEEREWRAAVEPVIEDWIRRADERTGGRGRQLYEEARALIEQYAAGEYVTGH